MKRSNRKHLPSVRFAFTTGDRFFTPMNDISHRRVTTVAGKRGTRGLRTVRVFEDRETLRAYVDTRITKVEDAGFRQVFGMAFQVSAFQMTAFQASA